VRILLIEDDQRTAKPLADQLRRENHVVHVVGDGAAGLAAAEIDDYDTIVLDIMLPSLNGLEVCRALRGRGSQTMILVVTARDALGDKVSALDLGADDYMTKPFELAELSARLRALSRRGLQIRDNGLRRGKLKLDLESARATYDGRLLVLTRTEYAILEAFLRYPARVFSQAALHDRAFNLNESKTPKAIKTHIGNLRNKLRAAGCPSDPIVTLYGVGYRIADAP
jgi:DNA-binding response OmpR family regulator